MPSAAQLAEATARFAPKTASLMSILPQVAGPMLGGLAGRAVAQRMGGSGALSETLGTIGGMTVGKYLGDEVLAPQDNQMPPGAPYALDPSSKDIPMWAMQGARFLRPVMKQGSAKSALRPQDVILGEIPGYTTVEGYRHSGVPGALKATAGGIGGSVAGGAAGYGAGRLLGHLLGRDAEVPGVNMPLSHLLAGLGATVGGAKGLQYSLGLNH
jgi:hypothetical protein